MPSICLSTSLKTNHTLIKKLLLFLERFPSTLASYSFRKLHPDALFAIQVRRSSDSQEMDIGFTSTGELDESGLLTFVGSGDGFVVIWYDQSGNNNHASQSVASQQPKLVDAGVVIKENDKPSLSFDGIDDRMFPSVVIGKDFSFFLVGKQLNTGNTRIISSADDNRLMTFNRDKDSFYTDYFVVDDTETTPGNSFASGSFIVGSESRGYVNGTDVTNNTGVTGKTWGKLVIGSSDVFNEPPTMNLSELILYDSDQSANRTGIEGDINSYYSIY